MITIVTDNPYRRDLVSLIMETTGASKGARLNALSAFLKASGITKDNLHSKASQPFVTKIHNYLIMEEMGAYIQNILSNPKSIALDPLIVEIYNGRYTILQGTPDVQLHVSSGVNQVVDGV